MKISDQDRDLLRQLQRDVTLGLAQLAELVGMAQSTVWRRLQEFERSGLIKKRVALLDPALAGANLAVLASIQLKDHNDAAIRSFSSLVARHPEIMECHAVSGQFDYMLKLRVRDVEHYEQFMTHNLLRNDVVQSVHSSFVLKEIKSSTEVPL